MAQIDDFLELVHKRRSIRRFTDEAVTPRQIENILEAARWAMSGADAQPWEFVVVTDEDVRDKIAASWYESHTEMYAIEHTRQPEFRLPPLREFATQPNFKDAPVLIVVLGDRRTHQASVMASHYLCGGEGSESTYLSNIANATQNMHLAAAAQGLGAKWISITAVWGCAIKDILGIPDILEVHTIVAVGRPAYDSVPGNRRDLKEMTHFERYDKKKYRSGIDIYAFVKSLREKTTPAYRQGFLPEESKGTNHPDKKEQGHDAD
jgi:5,6-dimethylbenzimidazole synthase